MSKKGVRKAQEQLCLSHWSFRTKAVSFLCRSRLWSWPGVNFITILRCCFQDTWKARSPEKETMLCSQLLTFFSMSVMVWLCTWPFRSWLDKTSGPTPGHSSIVNKNIRQPSLELGHLCCFKKLFGKEVLTLHYYVSFLLNGISAPGQLKMFIIDSEFSFFLAHWGYRAFGQSYFHELI